MNANMNNTRSRFLFNPQTYTVSAATMLVTYVYGTAVGKKERKSKERAYESVTMSCKSKTSIFISSYYSRFNNCYVVGYKQKLLVISFIVTRVQSVAFTMCLRREI